MEVEVVVEVLVVLVMVLEGQLVVAEMPEQETVECLRKVRGKLILVLMRFHQFCLSCRNGNMRKWKRSRQRSEEGRVSW